MKGKNDHFIKEIPNKIFFKGKEEEKKKKISWKKFWTNLPVVRDIGT